MNSRLSFLCVLVSRQLAIAFAFALTARAQEPATTLHPALFLVGDSITKTGTPPGDTGP
jgi:hypothetical protein